jgi:hypothetical protein
MMNVAYLLSILLLVILIPFVLQFVGLRFFLKRKDIYISSLFLIQRVFLAILTSLFLILILSFLLWGQGEDSFSTVIFSTILGLIFTSLFWVLIFRSKTKSISLGESFKSSILSLLVITLVFIEIGKNNIPNQTQFIDNSKAFNDLFVSTFTNNKLRKILSGIPNKDLIFQYSFIEGNSFNSNAICIFEVYKLEGQIDFNKKLPLCGMEEESFCWLFDLEKNIELLKTSELDKNKLVFNVGHSENYIYSKMNPIKLNWSTGSFIANDEEDQLNNGLFTYTDIILIDEINNQLIYIGKSGKNAP